MNAALEPHGFGYPEFVGPVTWGGLASIEHQRPLRRPATRGKPGDYLMGLEVCLAHR